MKRRHLVVYDYGQGGIWGFILAELAEEIHRRYPKLIVVKSARLAEWGATSALLSNTKPCWRAGDRQTAVGRRDFAMFLLMGRTARQKETENPSTTLWG